MSETALTASIYWLSSLVSCRQSLKWSSLIRWRVSMQVLMYSPFISAWLDADRSYHPTRRNPEYPAEIVDLMCAWVPSGSSSAPYSTSPPTNDPHKSQAFVNPEEMGQEVANTHSHFRGSLTSAWHKPDVIISGGLWWESWNIRSDKPLMCSLHTTLMWRTQSKDISAQRDIH